MVSERGEWLVLQTILLLFTLFVEFVLLSFWYKHEGSTLQLLGLTQDELQASSYQVLQTVKRLSLSLYGLSILILEVRFLSDVEARITSQAIRAPQVVQMIVGLVALGLLPLLSALLVYVVLLLVTSVYGALFSAVSTLGFVSSLLILFPRRSSKAAVIRGDRLLSHSEALKISDRIIEDDKFPIYIGGLWLPGKAATHHSLIIGEPGSGKSVSIQLLMESALCWIGRGYGHRAVLYDPKRTMMSILSGMKLDCEVLILDPFDERSVAWDIAKDVTDPDIARTIAEALIPEEKNTTQPYFRDTAAIVVNAVMQALSIRKAFEWSIRDLVLTMRSIDSIRKLVSSVPETEHYIAQHCKETSQTFQSVLSHAAGKIDWLTSVAAASQKAKRKISFTEWVSNEESILLLGSDKLRRIAMAELNRTIVTFLGLAALNLPDSGDRRTWFFLDEFTSLGKVDILEQLLYEGRSKGVCVLIAFQEIAQLIKHYGREGQRIITANTANKVMLRSTDPDTQKWDQSFFGVQERYEQSYSKNFSLLGGRASWGKSESLKERSLVLPTEFGTLPLASREHGISGFAKNPWIGSYRFNISGEIFTQIASPDPDTPNFRERAASDRKIEPFSENENKQLNGQEVVFTEKLAQNTSDSRPEERKVEVLESIRRIARILNN